MTDKTDVAIVEGGLKINGSISFDDLVNVAVAQHEDSLHEHRTRLQAEIQATVATNKKTEEALLESYKVKALAEVQPLFPTATIEVSGSFYAQTIKGKQSFLYQFSARAEMPQPKTLTNEYNFDEDDDVFEVDTPSKNKLRFNVGHFSIRVTADDSKVINDANAEEERLRGELQKINLALQELPRKTRQVKAAMARQRMEAEGMGDILANPEIQKILQLK